MRCATAGGDVIPSLHWPSLLVSWCQFWAVSPRHCPLRVHKACSLPFLSICTRPWPLAREVAEVLIVDTFSPTLRPTSSPLRVQAPPPYEASRLVVVELCHAPKLRVRNRGRSPGLAPCVNFRLWRQTFAYEISCASRPRSKSMAPTDRRKNYILEKI